MNVLLVDVDSKIPNYALMKIAAYHRAIGDNVGFNVGDPGKVYASVVFRKNRHKVDGLRFLYPDADIDIGGTGYDIHKVLPEEIDRQSPDYSIYPECDRFLGFTSRGCIRNCPFCYVPRKEGKFRRIYDSAKEALDHIVGDHVGRWRQIELLDNNILADKEWFMEVSQEIMDRGWKVDFNQGLDIRLLDVEIACRLAELRPIIDWKFAFDNTNYEKAVMDGIDLLNANGVDVRHKCLFYVYCDGDHQYEDAVYRCRRLKERNALAYVMMNADNNNTKRTRALKRWTRPQIFWTVDIDDYKKVRV